ncbi:MAG: hypothetical protein JXB39_03020 [Deltaproteobacteria bacterium]|nr:hypothetical protein [Deltaproteobacteria bacterium]
MTRPPPDIQARGPIGRKLIRAVRRAQNRKVVDLSAIRKAKEAAENYQEGEKRPWEMEDRHPVHAFYIYAQRQLSILVEQVSALREVRALVDAISAAESEYMPSGPPMSPLTGTYFFYWSVCDMVLDSSGETLASCTLDLVRDIGTDPILLEGMETLSSSRMGLYVHQGRDGDKVILGELVTGTTRTCVVPAGWLDGRGELWLVRVVPPPPFMEGMPHIALTTPYVIVSPYLPYWEAYLDRTLAPFGVSDRAIAYSVLMKYGQGPRYWPEYIFEAYGNHRPEAVFLHGLPDVPESRPWSKVSQERRGT